MKKIITLIIAASMLAISCQKELAPDNEDSNIPVEGTLTATIVQKTTKVSYTETPELDLQPAWEIGDEIIGFDDAGNTYTLTVVSVSAETATLSGTVPDGVLHLIYKSGAQASDINSKTLAIDYTAQAGNKTMPAVMLADGTVVDGTCHFAFTNAGAVIGISAVKGVPSGSTISKIAIHGANLSAATVALRGSELALTATTSANDAISTAALSGITTTDANGTLSTPVFIAVPAGAEITKVLAFVPKEPETMTIPSTAAEKEGIDYVTIAGKKWAKWNVGANSEADKGWHFAWADTKGYVWYADTWQAAEAAYVEFSYSLLSAKTAGVSDYMYVKTQIFTTGHSFDWANAPYQTQDGTSVSGLRFTKYLGLSGQSSPYRDSSANYDDVVKSVLDFEDDAARVNWGGSWRMPTSNEFQEMVNSTYCAWDDTDNGLFVFSPDADHIAGTQVSSIPSDLNKSSALLFFPVAGRGLKTDLQHADSSGYYHSSSLNTSEPTTCRSLSLGSAVCSWDVMSRYIGSSVRPVAD